MVISCNHCRCGLHANLNPWSHLLSTVTFRTYPWLLWHVGFSVRRDMLRADMLSDSLVAYTWHRAKYFLTLFRLVHTFVKCNWCVTYPIIAQDVKLLYEIRDVDILQNQGDTLRSGADAAETRVLTQVPWAAQSRSTGRAMQKVKGPTRHSRRHPRRKSSCLSRGPPGNLFCGEQGHAISSLARIMCSTKC